VAASTIQAPPDPSADPAATSTIRIERLSKTFGGARALSDVDLTFRSGEVRCLLGQNGSGKSTVIKVLSGYHVPDAGSRILVDDVELGFGRPTESRRLGMRFVHQTGGIVGALCAVENMALSSGFRRTRARTVDWRWHERRVRELLGQLGIEDLDVWMPLAKARPIDRTAVALARVLDDVDGSMRFLFLDEPTATLPAAEVDILVDLVRQIVARGIGVVYVTHRLDEVSLLGETVSVLKDGEHRTTRPVAELSQADLIRLIVGEDVALGQGGTGRPDTTRPPALRVARLRGGRLRGVDLQVASGEILGVAGITGSGREELARALSGAGDARADAVEVDGEAVPVPLTPRTALAARLVLAPSNTEVGSAVRSFTVRENLTLPMLDRYSAGGRLRRRRETATTRDWIDALAIDRSSAASAEKPYSGLSGGTQQKVILAKWLATDPKVLVCDEPTAGVDVGTRAAIYDLLREYAAKGVAFVVCSSDVDDLLHVCDRVVVLRAGRVDRELAAAGLDEHALLTAIAGGAP
jgi:ribose transport system ATP-binding protein